MVKQMTEHSRRWLFAIAALCGCMILLLTILDVSSSHSSRVMPVANLLVGLTMAVYYGYRWQHPQKKKDTPRTALLAALLAFLLCLIVAVFLVRFYGWTGFFLNSDSTASFSYALLLFVISIGSVLYAYVLKRKALK